MKRMLESINLWGARITAGIVIAAFIVGAMAALGGIVGGIIDIVKYVFTTT
jgi:hypothetical protein